MPTTSPEVQALLRGREVYFETDDDGDIFVPVPTKHYTNPSNTKTAIICIRFGEKREDGQSSEYLRFVLHFYKRLTWKSASLRLYQHLLEKNRVVKGIKFCVDPADGELSISHEVFVEDGPVSEAQIVRAIGSVASAADRFSDELDRLMAGRDPEPAEDAGVTPAANALARSEADDDDDDDGGGIRH